MLEANKRLSLLWLPKAPRVVLAGVKISLDEADKFGVMGDNREDSAPFESMRYSFKSIYTTDGHNRLLALKCAWKPTFDHKEIDLEEANGLLSEYTTEVKWDWTHALRIDSKLVRAYLSKLRPSACGRDGIHKFAYKFGGEGAVQYIMELVDAHLGKRDRPDGINDGMFVFLIKGEEKDDNLQAPGVVYRHPNETRPLTIKNEDNKCVAGVINWAITPVVRSCSSKLQNGFVPGRNVCNNIVKLDGSRLPWPAGWGGWSLRSHFGPSEVLFVFLSESQTPHVTKREGPRRQRWHHLLHRCDIAADAGKRDYLYGTGCRRADHG